MKRLLKKKLLFGTKNKNFCALKLYNDILNKAIMVFESV